MERISLDNIEDRILLLQNAAYIRNWRKSLPPHLQEPDETTEDDIREALQLECIGNREILDNKDELTRELRIVMRRAAIDQQR